MIGAVTLYRPVGSAELARVVVSQWKAFPEPLADHPVFHPSADEGEARKFARAWNARHNDDRCGFVLRFTVKAEAVQASDTATLNAAIVGPIWLIAEYGCK